MRGASRGAKRRGSIRGATQRGAKRQKHNTRRFASLLVRCDAPYGVFKDFPSFAPRFLPHGSPPQGVLSRLRSFSLNNHFLRSSLSLHTVWWPLRGGPYGVFEEYHGVPAGVAHGLARSALIRSLGLRTVQTRPRHHRGTFRSRSRTCCLAEDAPSS